MEEYCILLENLMYANVDAAPLWLRMIAKYLINIWNLKRSKDESCIFYKKDDNGKLEIVMSVHVDDVFMARKLEKLSTIKDIINQNFNIQ